MSDLTQWLIKTFEVAVPEGGRAHFEWGHLPKGETGLALVLGVAAWVALTVWLYRREGSASWGRKSFLAVCRLLVLAALLLVFLEPRLAVDFEQRVEGHTVVLWDTSLSMSLKDRYQEAEQREEWLETTGLSDAAALEKVTRQDLVYRLLMERAERGAGPNLIQALQQRNRVLVFGFGAKTGKLSTKLSKDELKPTGPATDLAQAVRTVMEETAGQAVAAVILISDGQVNRGEGEQGVVADLVARRIPLFAIGVGDPIPPKNLEVVDLSAEPRVLLGDPLIVEGTVRARGYTSRKLPIVLTVRPAAGGAETEVPPEDPLPALPKVDDMPMRVRFRYKPTKVGDYVFKLRIPPRKEEPVKEDNERSVPVKVTDDKTKVLLVAGGPSFAYHHLRTRLTRERAAVVSCWLQSASDDYPQAGNKQIHSLPNTLQQLQEYDAVVLLDPNPVDFDAPMAEAYKKFVAEHKGGLLFIPGTKYSAAFFQQPELKAFKELLPVIPGDYLDFTRASATERWPLKATQAGADHPASRIASRPELCRALWARLPGPFFSFPVEREKMGAEVLVRHEVPSEMGEQGGRPLLVTHYFQGGPVVFQGTDETWRWRSVGGKVFDRYWVSLMRYLIQGRVAGGRKHVELLSDKKVYYLGEQIRLRAHALDGSYRPLRIKEGLLVRAKVGADGHEVTLRPVKRPGWYQANFLPPATGTIEFSLRLPDDPPGSKPETIKVTVRRSDMEFADPRLNRRLLEGIAKATGGAYLTPKQAADLASRLPDAKGEGRGAPAGEKGQAGTTGEGGGKGKGKGKEEDEEEPDIESKSKKLIVAGPPIPLWDKWQTLALICAFLTIEWWVRKRSKMI